MAYSQSEILQEQWVRRRKADQIGDRLVLLEHPPVITLGRGGSPDNLLCSPEQLADLGVEYFTCGRGGEVTFHGPGQLVIYPILKLEESRRDLHRYLRDLEEVVLRTCADFGVEAERVTGRTGVWIGGSKVASVGVRASSWVTSHGIGLNYGDDLSGFDYIHPCGFKDVEMVSLQRFVEKRIERRDLEDRICQNFAEVFARRCVEAEKDDR